MFGTRTGSPAGANLASMSPFLHTLFYLPSPNAYESSTLSGYMLTPYDPDMSFIGLLPLRQLLLIFLFEPSQTLIIISCAFRQRFGFLLAPRHRNENLLPPISQILAIGLHEDHPIPLRVYRILH